MLNLSPVGPKYIIVTIGSVVHESNTTSIKCAICGNICNGDTQQDQIKKLFECLGKHIPEEHLYEVYEIEKGMVVTQINKSAWNAAKKRFKYKP